MLSKVNYLIHTEAIKENIIPILCNLENINADMIERNIPQSERLIKLNKIAIKQIKMLENNKNLLKTN